MSINVVTANHLLATSETNITDGGEKIIRHVTRDVREADIFAQGTSRQVHWADVFKCIVARTKEEKIMVRENIMERTVTVWILMPFNAECRMDSARL